MRKHNTAKQKVYIVLEYGQSAKESMRVKGVYSTPGGAQNAVDRAYRAMYSKSPRHPNSVTTSYHIIKKSVLGTGQVFGDFVHIHTPVGD